MKATKKRTVKAWKINHDELCKAIGYYHKPDGTKTEMRLEPKSNLALIIGNKGYILVCDECVHWVGKTHENTIAVPCWGRSKKGGSIFPLVYATLDMSELERVMTTEEVVWEKWVHYFGIKTRMAHNYSLLRASCKEVEADGDLPDFK